jgi:hypothetical protein
MLTHVTDYAPRRNDEYKLHARVVPSDEVEGKRQPPKERNLQRKYIHVQGNVALK